MVYEVPTAGHSDQEFLGLVAVDQQGWVVWYYPVNSKKNEGGHNGLPGVWDFLPESHGFSFVLLEVSYDKTWQSKKDGRMWKANSMMAQVTPLGVIEHQYIQ